MNARKTRTRYWLVKISLISFVSLIPGAATASTIAIDSNLFSIQSTPGIALWTGNTLMLSLGSSGGFTQTLQLASSILPADLVGISFEISSSLSNPRISFGYSTYDNAGYGQGEVALVNYLSPSWDLTTFERLTNGLGGGRTTSDTVRMFLGSQFNPFSLTATDQNALSLYPRFSLDFRADGWNGQDSLPGTVTFADINWITAPEPVPEPSSILLLGTGLATLWRKRSSRPRP